MQVILLNVLVTIISLFLVLKFNPRTIILMLFLWIPFQNFILPFLFTTVGIMENYIYSMILVKEILFLILFTYLFVTHKFHNYPISIKICFLFILLIVFYTILSTIFLDEIDIRQLRNLIFPFEAVITGYLAILKAKDLKLLLNIATYISIIVSVWGIFEVFSLDNSFYVKYLNIAEYNFKVKNDDRVIFSQGISGSSLGRAFLERRLSSTYGDPLSFGMANSFVLIFMISCFVLQKKRKLLIYSAIISSAIFLTFSRSSWLLIFVALMYIAIRKMKLFIPYCLAWVGLIIFLFSEHVRNFILETLTFTSDIEHRKGFLEFFGYLFDPNEFFGNGIKPIDWVIENGFLYIFYQVGFVGLVLFFLFLISLLKDLSLKESRLTNELVALIFCLKGIIIGIFFITNFSHYVFTFNHFFVFWVITGGTIRHIHDQKTLEANNIKRNIGNAA